MLGFIDDTHTDFCLEGLVTDSDLCKIGPACKVKHILWHLEEMLHFVNSSFFR